MSSAEEINIQYMYQLYTVYNSFHTEKMLFYYNSLFFFFFYISFKGRKVWNLNHQYHSKLPWCKHHRALAFTSNIVSTAALTFFAPDANGFVTSARGQQSTTGAPGYTPHLISVTWQLLHLLQRLMHLPSKDSAEDEKKNWLEIKMQLLLVVVWQYTSKRVFKRLEKSKRVA